MKKFLCILTVSAAILSGSGGARPADSASPAEVSPPGETSRAEATEMPKLVIAIGNARFTATLADNSSARALVELLSAQPLTIQMRDYGGFEKVGPLGRNLPTTDEQISTTAGDLILYQGNRFVIYYSANSWTFTRLGRMDGVTADGLKKTLGDGDVAVTLSLAAPVARAD